MIFNTKSINKGKNEIIIRQPVEICKRIKHIIFVSGIPGFLIKVAKPWVDMYVLRLNHKILMLKFALYTDIVHTKYPIKKQKSGAAARIFTAAPGDIKTKFSWEFPLIHA